MPRDKIDLNKLCASLNFSRKELEPYRVKRRDMVKQFAGTWWGPKGADRPVPVNLLAMYIRIVSRALIGKNPRVMLSTFNRQGQPAVSAMQSWANREIERTRLQQTMQRIVIDGLFNLGIAKVALASPTDAGRYSWNLSTAQPFMERVDLDDFVVDMQARAFEEVTYIGHRIRVPFRLIRDSDFYNKRARKLVQPASQHAYNAEGDERVSTLGRGDFTGHFEEFEEFADLWEVYLPAYKTIVTLADDDVTGATTSQVGLVDMALREQEWLGPATGPYQVLAYGIVPNNIMPKGPLQDLIDLHLSINRHYRKLDRQADRLKELTVVTSSEFGQNIQEKSDGDFLIGTPQDKAARLDMGGPNTMLVQYVMDLWKRFSEQAGNLESMGGLSPQSKTATQDKMLFESASAGLADMQATTTDFVSDALTSMCWYWWNHPEKVMQAQYTLPGMDGEAGMALPMEATPEQRQQVAWEDLEIRVDPYSLQHQTPQAKAQQLDQVMMQILTPLAPMLQQQNISVNAESYLQKRGRYTDMPDMIDLTSVSEPLPPEMVGPSSSEQPGMPGQTERTYTRRSLAGQSSQAKDAALMAAMQGRSGKSAETNGMVSMME